MARRYLRTNANVHAMMAHNPSPSTIRPNGIVLPADLRHSDACAARIRTVQYGSNMLTPVVHNH